eukprot:scaffold88800_cov69-Phaeocystis_antarctica.AAC.3
MTIKRLVPRTPRRATRYTRGELSSQVSSSSEPRTGRRQKPRHVKRRSRLFRRWRPPSARRPARRGRRRRTARRRTRAGSPCPPYLVGSGLGS